MLFSHEYTTHRESALFRPPQALILADQAQSTSQQMYNLLPDKEK
jgi:hypothetical protein